MKQTELRTATILATILLSAGILCACGDTAEQKPTTAETTPTAVTEETETEAVEVKDPFEGLAEADYNGREFRMLVRTSNIDELYTDALNGDVLNDAVYERNAKVEERYNTKIVAIPIDGDWESRTKWNKTVKTAVMAGEGAYELVDGYAAVIGDSFSAGVYLNLNGVPNLRLDMSWWSSLVRDELTVNGILYAITGDIAMNLWEQMQVIYYNKVLWAQHDLSSPYESVKNGTWTIDYYLSTIKDTSQDLDGDGKMTDVDRYGALFYDALCFDNLHNAFGVHANKRTSDGSVELDLISDGMVRSATVAYSFALENADVWFENKSVDITREPVRTMFMSDLGLTYFATLNEASVLRTMESDFGILPYPKYDEAQTGYYTTSRDGRSMFAVPSDVKDPAFAGMITEALCTVSQSVTIPVFYDTVLKSKTARDEESSEMLDIIRSGFVLDFAAEYAVQMESCGYIIRHVVENKKIITDLYAKNEKKYYKAFDKFIANYTES